MPSKVLNFTAKCLGVNLYKIQQTIINFYFICIKLGFFSTFVPQFKKNDR